MEMIMLQLSITRQKSRAKKGWASFVVDTRYALAGGTQHYFKTRDEAQNFIDKLNEETSHQNKVSDAWKWTLYQLAQNYIAHVKAEVRDGERSQSYLSDKIRYIDFFLDCVVDGKPLADMRVSDLTEGIVAHQVMDQLKVNRTKKTVANIFGGVSTMLKYGKMHNCCKTNPLEDVPIKGGKQGKGKNKAELIPDSVIKAIEENMNPRWQFIMRFACTTGVRQGEQRALTWGQILWEKGQVRIDRAIKHRTTKAGSTKTESGDRKIPLTHEVLSSLKELYIKQGRPNDPDALVFGTEFNHPVTAAKYLKRIKEACRRAGVAPIRWHDLRHYYASKLLQAYGDDLWRIKNYMGHANIRITEEIYGHWLDDDKDNAQAQDTLSAIF